MTKIDRVFTETFAALLDKAMSNREHGGSVAIAALMFAVTGYFELGSTLEEAEMANRLGEETVEFWMKKKADMVLPL